MRASTSSAILLTTYTTLQGECSINLGELEDALDDFSNVTRLEPTNTVFNTGAKNKIKTFKQKIKSSGYFRSQSAISQPVPNFSMEYALRLGAPKDRCLELAFKR